MPPLDVEAFHAISEVDVEVSYDLGAPGTAGAPGAVGAPGI